LLAIFAKHGWSPPLGASVALKIDKNEIEARKLRPLEVRDVVFTKHSQLSNS
jgi:hypothetical protein